MPNGTVKFFNATKGFGFITPDDGGKDIFVPTGSASTVSGLKAGQRVSFETQPDTKGPKAVNLTLLPMPQAPKPDKVRAPLSPSEQPAAQFKFYHDPDSDEAEDVLDDIRKAGHEPVIIDYIAAPPVRDELKRLSTLLKEGNQSLVKRYASLFRALQLDDRFLSENEFWDAVVEHPSLIDGPILAGPAKARICRSKSDVKSFLTGSAAGGADVRAKSKGLSARLLSLLAGESVPPAAPRTPAPEKVAPVAPVRKAPAVVTPVAKAKPAPKPAAIPKAKAKPKAAAKPVKPAKTVKAKPAKKAVAKKGKR